MKSTSVVSLATKSVEIAQMLTSRIGKKRLLLSLAATMACLQAATAATDNSPSYGRKAKAVLAGLTRTDAGLRRRLPETAGAIKDPTAATGGDVVVVLDGKTTPGDALHGAHTPTGQSETDGATVEDAPIQGQNKVYGEPNPNCKKCGGKGKMKQLDAEDNVVELKCPCRETGVFGLKKDTWKKIGTGVAVTGLVAGLAGTATQAIIATRYGFKDIKYDEAVGKYDAETGEQLTEVVGDEVQKQWYEDTLMKGDADMGHCGIAMIAISMFAIMFGLLVFLLFRNQNKMQGFGIGGVGIVGCILIFAGVAQLEAGGMDEGMKNYGEAFTFQGDSASSVLVSLGGLTMALVSLAMIGFLLYNHRYALAAFANWATCGRAFKQAAGKYV